MSIEIHDRTLNPAPALTKRVAFGDPDSTVENITFQQLLDLFNGGLITYAPIEIGVWNMDNTTSVDVNIPEGIDVNKIREISAIIKSDADNGTYIFQRYSLNYISSSGQIGGSVLGIVGTSAPYKISLSRVTGGIFDNSGFSTSGNRGWIVIKVLP